MAITLQQTDSAADSGISAGCSGETLNSGADAREATEGGTAGSNELMFDVSNASTEAVLMFQTDTATGEPNGSTWEAGDYVVRMNVTTAQNSLTWVATYVCERTSSGTFNTVASLTGQTTDITATGVHSHTINRATDYTAAADDSTLYFVIVVQNAHQHTTRTVGVTPDQQIDTPVEVSGGTIISETLTEGVSASDSQNSLATLVESLSEATAASDVISETLDSLAGTTLDLVQTDTAADDGFATYCSGHIAGNQTVSREATEGATAGSSEFTVEASAQSTNAVLVFQSDSDASEPDGGGTWEAGDWVVPINVTTAASNSLVTLEEVHICEVLSDGTSGGGVASATGFGETVDTTGVRELTVTQASDYTPDSSSSSVAVVVVVSDAGISAASFGVTPDQTINTPIETGAAGQTFSERLTEGISASDATANQQTFSVSVTEGVTASDEPDSIATLVERLAEATTVTDQLTAARRITERLTEGVSATDRLVASLRMVERLTESSATSDLLNATATMVERVTEGVAAGDVVDATATMVEAIAESVDASDVLTEAVVTSIVEVLTESVAATDAVSGRLTFVEQLTAAVAVTDRLGVTQTMVEALAEAVVASDVVTSAAQGVIREVLAEGVTATDRIDAALTFLEALTESVDASDALVETLGVVIAEVVTEGVAASDVVDARAVLRERLTAAVTVSDQLGVTQTMVEAVVESFAATDVVTESVAGAISEVLAESVATSDVVTSTQTHVERLVASVLVADALDASATLRHSITEGVTTTDALVDVLVTTVVEVLTEGVVASDQVDDLLRAAETLTEAVSATDRIDAALTMVEVLNEAVDASDEVTLPPQAVAVLAAIEALARISGAVDAEALVTAALQAEAMASGDTDAEASVDADMDTEASVDGGLETN